MYKRGKCWVTDFIYEGERYKKSWGPTSKTYAKEQEEKLKTEIREGRYHKKRDNPPFEKVVEEYLALHASNKQSYERYQTATKHLLDFFRGRKILDISNSPFLVERYKNMRKKELLERGFKAGKIEKKISLVSINRELACLKHMFNWLRKKPSHRTIFNPVVGVEMFRERERMRILSDEEEQQLYDVIEANSFARHLEPILTTALNTGMRKRKILTLRKDKVDFRAGYILVEDTKNGESRTIPMNKILTQTLKEVIKKNPASEYVFCDKDGKPFGNVRRSFENAVRKAGLDGLRFHDLRHTFATRLVMKGGDIASVKELLGHKSYRMTFRYSHPTPEHKKRVVGLLDEVPPKVTPGRVTELESRRVSS